ncbi:MurR/RpiR family transcriptional regulator [Rubellimicrobium arenae]|uniref:MurR/RpiR family transcriptional regulator n=1 Tax=Rubellimicrobium arenae TaxID=2817372 RepID=UPI001B30EE16|nr:MurR/RpiR family transcriptional regulator [Rubellimicrobium arenae]
MASEVGILEHIQSVRGGLKPTLQVVADAVLARPAEMRSMSIRELATTCGVSEASISRFVRGIGLPNYRAFQLRMVEEGASGAAPRGQAPDEGLIYENIGRTDTASTILTKVAHRNADVARACLSTLDPAALEQAARLVGQASTLYFFAAGLSALAAENALLRFARIGKPAIFHRDRNNQILLAGSLRPGSLAIGISDSGRTNQTVTALYAAKAAGVPTVAITAYADSPLSRQADVTLITPAGYQPSGDEPLYYESMVSKFGQLIAIDVLYSLVAVHDYDASAAAVRRGNQFIQASRTARRQNGTE